MASWHGNRTTEQLLLDSGLTRDEVEEVLREGGAQIRSHSTAPAPLPPVPKQQQQQRQQEGPAGCRSKSVPLSSRSYSPPRRPPTTSTSENQKVEELLGRAGRVLCGVEVTPPRVREALAANYHQAKERQEGSNKQEETPPRVREAIANASLSPPRAAVEPGTTPPRVREAIRSARAGTDVRSPPAASSQLRPSNYPTFDAYLEAIKQEQQQQQLQQQQQRPAPEPLTPKPPPPPTPPTADFATFYAAALPAAEAIIETHEGGDQFWTAFTEEWMMMLPTFGTPGGVGLLFGSSRTTSPARTAASRSSSPQVLATKEVGVVGGADAGMSSPFLQKLAKGLLSTPERELHTPAVPGSPPPPKDLVSRRLRLLRDLQSQHCQQAPPPPPPTAHPSFLSPETPQWCRDAVVDALKNGPLT